jgi:hypothetical protein
MHNKDNLSQLKGLVSNQAQWDKFSKYLDIIIAQQHKTMEQADSIDTVRRAQGAIYQLRRLQMLRDEVLKSN